MIGNGSDVFVLPVYHPKNTSEMILPSRRVLRIGHRGAAGHAPENTLASLEMAISLGVDLVEFDVRRSVDGSLVLIHDSSVDRTTNGQGSVESLPVSALRELDAGKGEQIPLLEEALTSLNGSVGAMIELKVRGIAAHVCKKVMAIQFQGIVIYASFFSEDLLTVRSVMADAYTLALFEETPQHPSTVVRDARATHAGLAWESVTTARVQALQEQGLSVFVYTVDGLGDITRMKRIGVDGIISNYPDRI